MKYFTICLVTVILLASCSDYRDTGRNAAEDVIALVKRNPTNVEKIVSELDSIEKLYHEVKYERDFEIGFEEVIGEIANTGFKHEVAYSRFGSELNGNLGVLYAEDDSHIFTLSEGSLVPDISLNLILYKDSNEWKPFDEFTGSMTLIYNSGTSKEYEFGYHDIQSLSKLQTQDKIQLQLPYRQLVGSISDKPLDDIIAAFKELNDIDYVNISLLGKNKKQEKSQSKSSANTMSDADLDEALKEYDEFLTSYLQILQKVNNQDMTALAEYPAMMQKAQSATEKLNTLQGQMTAEQLGKFFRLQAKYLQAMQELQ